jgi:peptidoglycan/xylan/chitin deacetylase (PgdA/CDA1 family)
MNWILSRRRLLTLGVVLGLESVAGGRQRQIAQANVSDTMPVYLTFDDGIETDEGKGKRGPTLDVLDILDARGIPATFFVHGRNTGNAEGNVLARMIRKGHHIGNHLVQQAGVTLQALCRPAYMARMFLETEQRIRQALAPFPDALTRYETQPRLFRRPGGGYDSAAGNLFLLPEAGYWRAFQYDRELSAYRHLLHWLEGVYDYSGWHLAVPPLQQISADPTRLVEWAVDGPGGVRSFIQPVTDRPELTTQEALDGLVILLHDPDPRVPALLPGLLDALEPFRVTYHTLPRPCDQPNQYTVGVGSSPHLVFVPGRVRERCPIP